MMVRGEIPRQAELICAEPQAGWSRRQLYCSLIALCIVWLAAFGQWALRDMVVPWDSKNQFFAFFRFMASAIAQGGTPFWNPFHYAGHPSIADPQSLIFAAPFLVWAFVWEAPSMLAFDAFVLRTCWREAPRSSGMDAMSVGIQQQPFSQPACSCSAGRCRDA